MTYKIFLSHSSSDKELVTMIADNAKMVGIDVYLYEHDFHPEKLIADKLKDAIKKSDAMVVLLTKNSQSSPYVQQEIGVAEGYEKLIIPLVESDIDQQNLAMLLGREYIPLDFNNPLESLSKLFEHLQKRKKKKEEAIAAVILLIVLLDEELKNKRKIHFPKQRKGFSKQKRRFQEHI